MVISNTAGGVASQAATLVVQVPPFIAAGPQSVSVARDQSASFSVTAGGTPPFQYQWRFNGLNLAGATNTSFLVTNAQAAQAGNYAVLVANSAGSALSANALLTVLLPPVITNQPAGQTVTNGATVTLAVGAFGTAPLAYQWRFNDTNLPGATGPSLVMSNAVLEQSGVYAAVVSNAYGTSTSSNATLLVLTKPVITAQPMNQTVLQGGTAIFTVTAYGTQPMGFRWRRNFGTVTNFVNSLGTSTLIVTNVQMTTNYTVVLTNQALPTGGLLSSNAVVTVLADADRDGLADAWEITYGLSPTNALDAAIDSDGDGMTNLEEYTAGTDPTNNLSYLKIDSLQRLAGSNQLWRVEFAAVSNKTYTVFQRDGFVAAPWVPWVNVDAAPTNRVLQLTNQPPPGWPQRYFRLLTPRLP